MHLSLRVGLSAERQAIGTKLAGADDGNYILGFRLTVSYTCNDPLPRSRHQVLTENSLPCN